MSRVVSNNVSQPRFYTLLLGVYAAIALLLAATGLYGVLSYTVGQRLAEIGIRMAVGASTGNVVGLVVRHALTLVCAGVLVGLCGASALTRLLASQLYRTAPTDTATFVVAPLILIGVALAATWVPARRAIQVDPAVTLRRE